MSAAGDGATRERGDGTLGGSFPLAGATPARWAEAAAAEPLALLSDHAHCELKAAASAMALMKRNPDRPGLALRLAPLIREETEHLHRVLRELDARGATLGRDADNPYPTGLLAEAKRTRRPGEGHLDHLLVSALIEKRSHERFERLQACQALADLAPLYAALGEAEARHGCLFTDLAEEAFPAARVAARYAELAAFEATHIAGLPPGPRVHSGWGG